MDFRARLIAGRTTAEALIASKIRRRPSRIARIRESEGEALQPQFAGKAAPPCRHNETSTAVASRGDECRRTKAPDISRALCHVFEITLETGRSRNGRPWLALGAAGARATAEKPAPEAPLRLRDLLHNKPLSYEIRFGRTGMLTLTKMVSKKLTIKRARSLLARNRRALGFSDRIKRS